MNTRLGSFLLIASLLAPCGRAWTDNEKAESPKEEKTESPQKQQAEEQQAFKAYDSAVAKHGKDSTQAKKAWKRVVREYKEHGHTPPASPDAVTQPAKS